jgi:tRNA A37 threonylcarbamoyladenosine synthetase subunit TsaC/SUA5/YrdC
VPSTVVDLTADDPLVLREGAVSAAQIGEVLGVAVPIAS